MPMVPPPLPGRKSDTAFRTIGEVSSALGVPQHVLRYWETRFPQVKPLQRAGNRRYYRPDDVALLQQIQRLLNQEGYSIRGVQKVLADGVPVATPPVAVADPPPADDRLDEIVAVRDLLRAVLQADARQAS